MPQNKPVVVTAWVVRVTGYLPGMPYASQWWTVLDGLGNSVSGLPSDSAAAVQIRYVDTVGLPDRWHKLKGAVSCVGLGFVASQAEGEYRAQSSKLPARQRVPVAKRGPVRFTFPLPPVKA